MMGVKSAAGRRTSTPNSCRNVVPANRKARSRRKGVPGSSRNRTLRTLRVAVRFKIKLGLERSTPVNVFDLDRALVRDYERFARSFTQIRAPDIRHQVEAIYATDRFWPDPLISINPRFERGASIRELAEAGTLHGPRPKYLLPRDSHYPYIGIKLRQLRRP
jgi:hypothetical protein